MNVIDFAALVLLLVFARRGYLRGLVQEGFEAAAAVAGLVTARAVYVSWAARVSLYAGLPEGVTRPVLFAATAVAVASVGFALAPVVRALVVRDERRLRAEQWGGAGFGLAKGLILCVVLIALAAQVPLATVAAALDSSAAGRFTFAVMPELYRHVNAWLERSP